MATVESSSLRQNEGRNFAALQLAFLVLLFALPLFGIELGKREHLEFILVTEFIALAFGSFVVMLLVPAVATQSWVVRIVCIFLSALILYPMGKGIYQDYGFINTLVFIWLIFANYGSPFFVIDNEVNQSRVVGELALRWVVYLVSFALISVCFDLPLYVDDWADRQQGLIFGLCYFSYVTYLEFIHFFPRTVSRVDYVLHNPDQLAWPKNRKLKMRQGKILGRYVGPSPLVSALMIFSLGFILLAMCSSFFYFSFEMPWLGRILFWIFLLPFALIGLVFFVTSLKLIWIAINLPGLRLHLRLHKGQIKHRELLGKVILAREIEKTVANASAHKENSSISDLVSESIERDLEMLNSDPLFVKGGLVCEKAISPLSSEDFVRYEKVFETEIKGISWREVNKVLEVSLEEKLPNFDFSERFKLKAHESLVWLLVIDTYRGGSKVSSVFFRLPEFS